MRIYGIALLALLAACESDQDNVSWVVVSNPSGDFNNSSGGAVVVIRANSISFLSHQGETAPVINPRYYAIPGYDSRGIVTVFMPRQADVAVLDYGDSVLVRSPELPNGFVDVPFGEVILPTSGAAAISITMPDSSILSSLATGPGALHVSANGNLLALEHFGGVVPFDGSETPEIFPTASTLDVSGAGFVVTTPFGNQRVLFAPPPPPLELRVAAAPGGALRVFGPRGEVLAVLPEDRVQLLGGASGLFLTASFPEGLNDGGPPMSLTMVTNNRYLLRVDP